METPTTVLNRPVVTDGFTHTVGRAIGARPSDDRDCNPDACGSGDTLDTCQPLADIHPRIGPRGTPDGSSALAGVARLRQIPSP